VNNSVKAALIGLGKAFIAIAVMKVIAHQLGLLINKFFELVDYMI
jgi:hypothetical protein